MILAVHQPQYLPWLGYFDKIDRADVFCILDNVQYKKNEWQNRNRIKTAKGPQWLTVPVRYRFPQRINEVMINQNVNWPRKHLQAILTNYRKAPFFDQYFGFLKGVYTKQWTHLSDLNTSLIKGLCGLLGVDDSNVAVASMMDLRDDPTDRLIDICKALGCDTYLSGQAGADYMDLKRFEENRIKVVFQDFVHPVYPQRFSGFVSHLSVVDLLMNCGPDSLSIIRAAQGTGA